MFSQAGSLLAMSSPFLPPTLALALLAAGNAAAQIPSLPGGAQSHWVVADPQELVVYLTFNPANLQDRLPGSLRFLTVKGLATRGVPWAADYLTKQPNHGAWGISFLEIVRMGTFSIDGRSPSWPRNGAAALWFARVEPSDPSADLGPGTPFLALEFWLPDRAYVSYMRQRGYYATYGDVSLSQAPGGRWLGSVKVKGLTLKADCLPQGPLTGGAGSAGMQTFFAPRASGLQKFVRVAFAGHQVQACSEDSTWTLRGTHPAAGGTLLPPANFEFGYRLVGGTYDLSLPRGK